MPHVVSGTAAGTGTPSFNLNIAGSNLWLVIEVTVEDGAASATCTVDGVAQPTTAWDGVSGVVANNGTNNRVFALRAPPTGAAVPITCTTAGGANKGIAASLYDAVDQTTPFDGLQTSTDTGLTPSVTVVGRTGDLVVGGIIDGGIAPRIATPPAEQTLRVGFTVGSFSRLTISDEASGASIGHSYTRDDIANFGSLLWAVNLRAAAGGGPSATPALGRWRRVGPAR